MNPAPGVPTWSLGAQRAFSAGLVSIDDWRGTLKQAVKLVGVEGNWDAVVVWSPEQRRKDMKCAAMWSSDALSATTFETRVWQHRHKLPPETASVESNVTAPLDGARDGLLKAAAEAGMNSTVLVPIADGTQLLGMLQLFSSQSEPPSSELILSIEAIGLQLASAGRLLESAGTPHWRLGRL
jgi:transcriptional regulator with GAF, ATPase, and Fis domain